MSAAGAEPAAPVSGLARRMALIRARSGISPVAILLLPIGAFVYAYFAHQAELIGQSSTAVAILTALFLLSGSGMLLRSTSDRIELFRLFSLYYLMVFCIGPLFEPAVDFYVLDEPKPVLLERTAWLALFAYLSIALGYFLPLYGRAPAVVMARHDEYDARLASVIGLSVWAVGVVSFVALFVFAGGAAVILRGEGAVQRSEFAFGLGVYYWLSLGMVSGGAVYFAAQASQRRLLAWVHAWPLVGAFLLLVLLQGRHRAIMPMLVMFFVSNYVIRRLRIPRLAVYATIGMALAVVMNVARSPTFRGTFATDPIGFTLEVLSNFGEEAREELAGGIGRIDEMMIIVDHVPDRMPYDYGYSLIIPFNPILRLIGRDDLQGEMVGERLYVISRPDMRDSPYRTGFLPSIVGEMRANLPVPFCFIPLLLFGMLLRFVYQRLVLTRSDFASIAAYAILALFLCNTTIGAIGQSAFEMAVVAAPVFVMRWVVRKRRRRGFVPEALPEAVATREA